MTNVETVPVSSQVKSNDRWHLRQRASPPDPRFTRTHKELQRYSFPSVFERRKIGHLTGNRFSSLSCESIISFGFLFLVYKLIITFDL